MIREKELKVGVGQQKPGRVRLSAGVPRGMMLSVAYKGERAASVLLTPEQVSELRAALEEIEPAVGTDGQCVRLKLAA
ncbi:MAG TPA: hypothetical protein VK421_13845 [Pyrinomonadaceae bacterium]|nr:hypothetical protein [Pyrinomonadaceae bacterium]